MKRNLMSSMLVLGLFAASCRQVDVRTVAIHVPGMKSEACVNLVLKALATEQGIYPAQVNVKLETRTLEVRFDSLTKSLKNLEMTIADAGFDANEVPANAAAHNALPVECR